VSATAAVVVIQARMGSSRLPGKVLRPIGGRPLLGLMLDRIATGGFPVVVATSTLDRDDPIERFLSDREEALHRGSEYDVLRRAPVRPPTRRAPHR
jgi:spore coat polysaccharide biosynthesis protein SpsF